ncbi:MAG: hypothetical protein ACK55I_30490, partial [bacterium]
NVQHDERHLSGDGAALGGLLGVLQDLDHDGVLGGLQDAVLLRELPGGREDVVLVLHFEGRHHDLVELARLQLVPFAETRLQLELDARVLGGACQAPDKEARRTTTPGLAALAQGVA